MRFLRALRLTMVLALALSACSAEATVTMLADAPRTDEIVDADDLGEALEGAMGELLDDAFDGVEFEMGGSGTGAFSMSTDGDATVMGDSPRIPAIPPSEPNRVVTTGSEAAVARTINDDLFGAVNFDWQQLPLEDDDTTFTVDALVPVGWEFRSIFGATFDAPDSMDFFTEISFDTGCQGTCEPKDWQAEVMDNAELSPFSVTGEVEVLVRQELTDPPGRLTVYQSVFGSDPVSAVTLTRWDDDAGRYFLCKAELHGADAPLWPGFADACVAARPAWL